MVKREHIAILAWFASVFALCVIALGAFTRLIDAGLGCPDWPLCYGHFIVSTINPDSAPLVAYKAWAEMIHRYFAGTLSCLILAIVILIFIRTYQTFKKEAWKLNFFLSLALIILVAYQIILGQLTVTLKLLPIIVTQHLLGGYLILSVLWLIYLNNKAKLHLALGRAFLPWALLGIVLLFLQIMLGAWTSTNYASLSCSDFPLCHHLQASFSAHFKEAFNIFSPTGINYEGGVLSHEIRQTIQMTHRLGALIVTCYLLILTAILNINIKPLRGLSYILIGLLFLQICFGISNVVFKLPLMTAIAHTITAVLLLLTLITIAFRLAKTS